MPFLRCGDVSEVRIASILRVEDRDGCSHLLTLVPHYVSPKHGVTQEQKGATSQKTAFFIVTAVKTSNPIR
jgi:hypothetical protein